MEKELTTRKTLWMRYIDFEKVKDILHLIYKNNGKLKAGELENLGMEKRIMVKENGKPLTHTPRFHFRKVLENLGLVEVKHRVYYISNNNKILDFINMTKFNMPMSDEAKEIIREKIVENSDCRKYFFDAFMETEFYNLEELRNKGKHIFIETKSMVDFQEENIKYNNIENAPKKKKAGMIIFKTKTNILLTLKTWDEINAIYWGVRLWALNLGMINEIVTDFREGKMIYPVNIHFTEKFLYDHLSNKLASDKNNSEWLLIYIPIFIQEIVLFTHFSILKIKEFLWGLKEKYPASVMFIPTSTVFIDIKTPFEKQDAGFRNSYLYDKNKGYISHLRINKNIIMEVFT
jgi:hypothetical protein